jgi:hypothetical protein
MTEYCIGGSCLVGGLCWLRSGRSLHGPCIGVGRTAHKSQPLRKQGTKAEAEHDFLNAEVTPHEAVLVVACVLEVQLVDVGKLTRAHRASRPYGFRVCGMLMFADATTPAGHSQSLCLSPTAEQFPVPRAPVRSGDLLKHPELTTTQSGSPDSGTAKGGVFSGQWTVGSRSRGISRRRGGRGAKPRPTHGRARRRVC